MTQPSLLCLYSGFSLSHFRHVLSLLNQKCQTFFVYCVHASAVISFSPAQIPRFAGVFAPSFLSYFFSINWKTFNSSNLRRYISFPSPPSNQGVPIVYHDIDKPTPSDIFTRDPLDDLQSQQNSKKNEKS